MGSHFVLAAKAYRHKVNAIVASELTGCIAEFCGGDGRWIQLRGVLWAVSPSTFGTAHTHNRTVTADIRL